MSKQKPYDNYPKCQKCKSNRLVKIYEGTGILASTFRGGNREVDAFKMRCLECNHIWRTVTTG